MLNYNGGGAIISERGYRKNSIFLSRHGLRVISSPTPLIEYEEQRKRNIRDLYDKVQESLISAGFIEVAALRGAFSRETLDTSESGGHYRSVGLRGKHSGKLDRQNVRCSACW
jgi:hypothetical protein